METNTNKISLPSINNYTLIDNIFLGAVKNLSLNGYKLFALMAAQIKRNDEDFIEYEIKVDDLRKLFNVKDPHYIYEILRDATNELHEIKVIIDNEDERTQYPWLTKSSYLKNEGTAILKFHEDLKPFLLRLNTRYSKVWLSQTFNFATHSTKNIYLYLCENRYKESFTVSLHILKGKLGIDKNSYQKYSDFKRRILEPSHKEIHKKTLLKYDYSPERTGRKITHVKFRIFTIKMNTKNQNIPKLEKISEITKLKEEYYREKELYMQHLLNDASENDILEFKNSLNLEQLEFNFEENTPKDVPFRYFLSQNNPFKSFDEWLETKEANIINVDYKEIHPRNISHIEKELEDLGWNGNYTELVKEVLPEAIEAYLDNLKSEINKIDKSKLDDNILHEYIDESIKAQAMRYYKIFSKN